MTVVASFVPGVEGEAALESAYSLAQRMGGPLIVVGARPDDETRVAAEQALAVLNARGGPQVTFQQNAEGQDAVEAILDVIDAHSANVLVIGLRRRSPVGKLVLGTSAQRLLLDAPCPVLCVKSDGVALGQNHH